MQNSLVCNDIIPQNDPRVQEVIKRLNLSNNFNLEVIGVQNMQQLEGLTQLLEKLTPNVLDNFKDRIEQFKQKAELFNEQVKSMLALSTLKTTTTVANIYKRIVSCSRTPRSNNRLSNFSKSTKGDSGDSDQPGDPPRHYHLNSSSKNSHCIKQNSFTLLKVLSLVLMAYGSGGGVR